MEMITLNRGVPTGSKVSELQDEEFLSFNNNPFEFEDTVSDLWDDTQKVYYHACTANRFSEKYLVYCNQLEKNIRQLGSFCLTKAVLEQKGIVLPKLNELTVHELVCMVSFHFRKAHAALDGIYKDNNLLGITYLNWEFRWVGLGNRLKATEVRIKKIKEGKLKADSILEQSETFKNTPGTPKTADGMARSLNLNPKALPVNGSFAREMIRKETEECKKEDRFLKEQGRRLNGLKGRRNTAQPFGLPPAFRSASAFEPLKESIGAKLPFQIEFGEEEPDPVMVMEDESRKILIESAFKREDQDCVLMLRQEDEPACHEQGNRHIEELRTETTTGKASARGPSQDTRNVLRCKRKKRKK